MLIYVEPSQSTFIYIIPFAPHYNGAKWAACVLVALFYTWGSGGWLGGPACWQAGRAKDSWVLARCSSTHAAFSRHLHNLSHQLQDNAVGKIFQSWGLLETFCSLISSRSGTRSPLITMLLCQPERAWQVQQEMGFKTAILCCSVPGPVFCTFLPNPHSMMSAC